VTRNSLQFTKISVLVFSSPHLYESAWYGGGLRSEIVEMVHSIAAENTFNGDIFSSLVSLRSLFNAGCNVILNIRKDQ
jgi:hypothetical protein